MTENESNGYELTSIPYVAYESALAKAEKREKRKDYIILSLVLILAGIIGGLFYIFSTFDFVAYEQCISGDNVGEQNINDGIHIDGGK